MHAKGITGGISGVLDVFKSDEDFFNRGIERLQNRQYQEAIEDFTQAIAINYKYADAYFLRGCIRSDPRYNIRSDRGLHPNYPPRS